MGSPLLALISTAQLHFYVFCVGVSLGKRFLCLSVKNNICQTLQQVAAPCQDPPTAWRGVSGSGWTSLQARASWKGVQAAPGHCLLPLSLLLCCCCS